jgi:hypothetical protein
MPDSHYALSVVEVLEVEPFAALFGGEATNYVFGASDHIEIT